MGAAFWLKSLGAAIGGLVLAANVPTSWWMPKDRPTLEYLASTDLRRLDEAKTIIKEARELSSLKPELDSLGVKLYAVTLESFGAAEFQEYFDGEVFVDKQRKFYGPTERRMGLLGMLRPSTFTAASKAKKTIKDGNLKGEGRILGGVFLIGSGQTGIVYDAVNMDFGDTIDVAGVLEAARKLMGGGKPHKL